MIVALNTENKAIGDLFWDDGDGIDTIANKKFSYIQFSYEETLTQTFVSISNGTSPHNFTRYN